MAEEDDDLDGVARAAILLMTLGEGSAAEVLKHLGPKEVHKLGMKMASLSRISPTQVNGVVKDFLDAADDHTSLGIDNESFLRSSLTQALGDDKAQGIIDRILLGGGAKGLQALKWMEPRSIAEIIAEEHPQIIAIVLAFLEEDQASEVYGLLPEKTRPEVLMRVATLESVQPAALQELNRVLEQELLPARSGAAASIGGVRTAAQLLGGVDSSTEGEILEELKELNADLSQEIQDQMFVFDNLLELDDIGMQTLLREIASESLLLALKGSDEKLKEKFFNNMSRRAADMLRDDLEAKGPVRLSEVEEAQKEILGIAARLSDEGRIMLGGKGGEEFV